MDTEYNRQNAIPLREGVPPSNRNHVKGTLQKYTLEQHGLTMVIGME